MRNEKKLDLSDYISLWLLSLRGVFWRIDGRQASTKFARYGTWGIWISIILCLLGYFGWIPFLMYGVIYPILGIADCIKLIFTLHLLQAVKELLLYIFSFVFFTLAFRFIYIPICTDSVRFKYNLHFKDSAWWKNTGITPSEIRKDKSKGLYGEYIATISAEQNLKTNNVTGYVFNNVIVPKRDGDFNEIDIVSVSVSEMGIHVIEAKARTGAFYGNYISPKWKQIMGQNTYEMENPLIQNLTHINYLTEYLYENLPDCPLKKQPIFDKMKNVALFTLTGIEDHLDQSKQLSMDFFIGMAEDGYRRQTFTERKLSKEEVKLIADLLKKISFYPREQYQQMIQERAIRQEKGEFSHPYKYYVTRGVVPYDNNVLDAICRDNGYYRTYYDRQDDTFKAYPEMTIQGRSKASEDFDEVYAYFNKM